MRFNTLNIDPALSPGILDTATWDRAAAWQQVLSAVDGLGASPDRPTPGLAVTYSTRQADARYVLAGLPDGQQVFLRMGPDQAIEPLGPPLGRREMADGQALMAYPTDAEVLDRFFREVDPSRGPRALGPVPRLGVGTRMTTLVWPAIWHAMSRGGFATNAIQNSVRELNLLEPLLAGQPAEKNVAFNFGVIETGYTGSTFEGLWVAGVLSALQAEAFPTIGYGADADHIQVKRGASGLERALRLVNASRFYTFYTLDVSDVLDYAALLSASPSEVQDRFEAWLPDDLTRRALVADYARPRRIAGRDVALDSVTLARLAAKYGPALDAVEKLVDHIQSLKGGVPFDLEISIDEHPGEVATFDCLTSDVELVFLLSEAQRRGIPLTHVAPNYGVEKGVDYACPDGLPGLEQRAALLNAIAEEFGVMADFHSGDDLSQSTRQAIRRATQGRLHFKVSPMLQLLFGEVLAEYHPDLFSRWWADALAYARREAADGSTFAADCVRQAQAQGFKPSPHDAIFHHFSFAFVGRRDAEGQFMQREEFYCLSPAFQSAYTDRIESYLLGLADDLLVPSAVISA